MFKLTLPGCASVNYLHKFYLLVTKIIFFMIAFSSSSWHKNRFKRCTHQIFLLTWLLKNVKVN